MQKYLNEKFMGAVNAQHLLDCENKYKHAGI